MKEGDKLILLYLVLILLLLTCTISKSQTLGIPVYEFDNYHIVDNGTTIYSKAEVDTVTVLGVKSTIYHEEFYIETDGVCVAVALKYRGDYTVEYIEELLDRGFYPCKDWTYCRFDTQAKIRYNGTNTKITFKKIEY